jgi:phosphate transport system substrate-binding protein
MRKHGLRKCAAVAVSVLCLTGALAGCGSSSSSSGSTDTKAASSKNITVVSREDGSGTRGAFIELVGVEQKDSSGKKIDMTSEDAVVVNSTATVITTVAGDESSIGYISLGALNSTVKAVKVSGVEATADNVKNGSYKLSRPFNIATKGTPNELSQDFINYIMSADGQKIVEDNGYISESNTGTFTSAGSTGKIVVAGSSSVTPVMEKLIEGYKKVNSGATIELQESDSTTGMTAVKDGTCDIGMASRELKDSEKSAGLTSQAIALDGIAVVVNSKNSISDMTIDQIKSVYTGETTEWSKVK